MKHCNLSFVVLIIGLMVASDGMAALATTLEPGPGHQAVQRSIARYLTDKHYSKLPVNDELSSRFLDSYLMMLDPSRLYFTGGDIRAFEPYRDRLDDALQSSDLQPAYRIFHVFQNRQKERFSYLLTLLEQGLEQFDFSRDEYLELDRKDASWLPTKTDAKHLWRKQLKANIINITLQDKPPAHIIDLLTKRYKNRLHRVDQASSEDVFQIYMNALARLYDPHTEYLSPRTSENFNINMSLSLEGIGALLRLEDEFTTVVRLIPAGPADKGNKLQPKDRILAVGQEDGEMTDIVGWRLDDVVDLIRGPKGTLVRLEVGSDNDSETRVIEIVRNTVTLEEQSAKGSLLEASYGGKKYKIGSIKIPIFYSDFNGLRDGDPDYRSSTKDVQKLLDEFKGQDLAGLVIDLRNNGGGSLQEASSLVGLFVASGPTVQVRHTNNKVNVLSAGQRKLSYAGPLAVLVNRLSASASEIFAAAIQDYRRGLVLGTQTYGKGTVQVLTPLQQGQLKLTQAKFYRISGQSTQHLGIVPDIELPFVHDPERIGESTLDNALPGDSIRHARYRQYDRYLHAKIDRLAQLYQKRLMADPELLQQQNVFLRNKQRREDTEISLNEERRRLEDEEDKQWRLTQENSRRTRRCLPAVDSLDALDALPENEDSILGCVSTALADVLLLGDIEELAKQGDQMAGAAKIGEAVATAAGSQDMAEQGKGKDKPVNISTEDPRLAESSRILIDLTLLQNAASSTALLQTDP